MTLKEFKATNGGGYVKVAAEDIPGFYNKGQRMYGDCDDMIIADWLYQPLNGVYTVFLKNEVKS